jgi:hypothetical protein
MLLSHPQNVRHKDVGWLRVARRHHVLAIITHILCSKQQPPKWPTRLTTARKLQLGREMRKTSLFNQNRDWDEIEYETAKGRQERDRKLSEQAPGAAEVFLRMSER